MSPFGEPNKDLFRDTPVRYLGYANEIGEAFRNLIGAKLVGVSYGIATLYVLADTVDKTIKTHKKQHSMKHTIYTAVDVFTWQMLASVIIPGFTINRVCAGTNYVLKRIDGKLGGKRPFIVTGVGLAIIPFIIKPIDRLVDDILDHTLRKIQP